MNFKNLFIVLVILSILGGINTAIASDINNNNYNFVNSSTNYDEAVQYANLTIIDPNLMNNQNNSHFDDFINRGDNVSDPIGFANFFVVCIDDDYSYENLDNNFSFGFNEFGFNEYLDYIDYNNIFDNFNQNYVPDVYYNLTVNYETVVYITYYLIGNDVDFGFYFLNLNLSSDPDGHDHVLYSCYSYYSFYSIYSYFFDYILPNTCDCYNTTIFSYISLSNCTFHEDCIFNNIFSNIFLLDNVFYKDYVLDFAFSNVFLFNNIFYNDYILNDVFFNVLGSNNVFYDDFSLIYEVI